MTEKSTVPDGATEQDRVLEDDGQPRSESLQRQLGDVDVINHNPSCVIEVYKNTPISPIKTLFLFFFYYFNYYFIPCGDTNPIWIMSGRASGVQIKHADLRVTPCD